MALGPGEWTAIGFLMFGLLLIVLEVFNPGFFIAVPGGALFLGGGLALAFPGLMFESAWAWLLWPLLLGVATVANIWIYKVWAPPSDRPLTLSMDSLPGEIGTVEVDVRPGDMMGKVRIKGQIWSARPHTDAIAVGEKVRIIRSEGVHVIVEKV